MPMPNTMGSLASPAMLDLGLGQVTTEQLQQQLQERRKKKLFGAAGVEQPDLSTSPATALLFGMK